MIEVQEARLGRRIVRVGDRVRVRSSPGRRNGFDAVVRAIRLDEDTGSVTEVEVFGGRRGRFMFRTFRPERIARVARQTRRHGWS